MTTYWAVAAQLPGGLADRVRLTVVGDRFTGVEVGVEPEPADVRVAALLMPGLANAHSHAFHRALRGRTHGDGGSFWTWRKRMYEVASRLDPDSYLALARALYAEMALAGITVVGEFHYLHHGPSGVPYEDPNAMGHALIRAAADAGIRLTLLDTCYLRGGLDSGGYLPLEPVQQRFSDGDVDAWASRVEQLRETDLARVGLAAHSVRALHPADLSRVAEHAGGRRVHVHLSEQPAENAATRAVHGRTPTELLDGAGLLGPRTTVVHATHLGDGDIQLLGGSRTTACFCPTTERDLADGIGPARALRDAGCPLALGSDQHAVVDMFEELRGLEMHERLRTGRRGSFTPAELVQAASAAGYDSLGWPEGGRLAVGALADFIVVRTGSVRTAGCAPDQVCYAATGADVDRVVVGGRTVVADGEHQLVADGEHRLGGVGALLAGALATLEEAS